MKAFTLVEIMIVVVILGLSVAIGIPGFLKARNRSRMSSEMANLKTISDAGALYELNQLSVIWDGEVTVGAAMNNITLLWPSSSAMADPNSYISRQLFCPFLSNKGYGYISPEANHVWAGKGICEEHFSETEVLDQYGD